MLEIKLSSLNEMISILEGIIKTYENSPNWYKKPLWQFYIRAKKVLESIKEKD